MQKKYVLSRRQNRREFLIETDQNNCMTRRIGNTTYQVKVFLSENATESFQDKLLWLVRHCFPSIRERMVKCRLIHSLS